MRIFGTLTVISAITLLVGCSSDSDNATTATGGASAATGGGNSTGGNSSTTTTGGAAATGGAANGGSSNTVACNAPDCIATPMATCAPTGACVQATDATTGATNKCFDNGVKTASSFAIATMTISMTTKNASGTCYSLEGTLSALQFKDPSGNVVGTGAVDLATQSLTVTCTGGQPVVLNSGCDAITAALNPMGGTSCTTGTCTL